MQSRDPDHLTGCAAVAGELPLPSTFPHSGKVCAVGEWVFSLEKGVLGSLQIPVPVLPPRAGFPRPGPRPARPAFVGQWAGEGVRKGAFIHNLVT